MDRGKLMDREFVDHNIAVGCWMYEQPYYKDMLARINAVNPARALMEREHCYLASFRPDYYRTILEENYDVKLTAVQVDEILGSPVWRFDVSES